MTYKIYDGSNWVDVALKSDIKTYYNHHITLTCLTAVLNIDFISSKSDAYTVVQLFTLIATRGGRLGANGFLYDRGGETDCAILCIEQYVNGRDRYIRVRVSNIDAGSNETYDFPTTLATTISDSVVAA